jgi:hypothetical protein
MNIETKLRRGSQAVRQATSQAEYSSRSPAEQRRGLSGPVLAVASGLVIVALFAVPAMLAGVGGQPPGGAGDSASPVVTSTPTAKTAAAERWAETLVWWVDTIFPGDSKAQVTEYGETADLRAVNGSLEATVASADGQRIFAVEYQGYASGGDRDAVLQEEIAEMLAREDTRHIGTGTFSSDEESAVAGNGVEAEYFLTQSQPQSVLVTVLTAPGRLVVQVEVTDPSLLPDEDQLNAIATGMFGSAHDLRSEADESTSTGAEPQLGPTAEEWTLLDNNVWVASVQEGEQARLWVRTDTQQATPAPSTNTRTFHAYTGSDLVIIIVGHPIPDVVTVEWDDGTKEAVAPDWNQELDMGIARFEARDADLVSVEGP